ncbi:MAG: tryptophan synthase subunit alpha [Spirochaetes bacterium]|nr:tryptophan synthase subunit alpha [Spirochaetota bacterium]
MKGYNGLYLMGNYPTPKVFIDAARLGMEYFDFLEIGIPFSDPIADGPVIERAAMKVIADGHRVADIFKSIEKISCPSSKKIYVMTYANHIFARGNGTFARMMKSAGTSGIILPDVPSAESDRFKKEFAPFGIELIHFITPENTYEQIESIASSASGFLYCISIRGITGSRFSLESEMRKKIAHAKKFSRVPVVLGFGIRDGVTAAIALRVADGFIVGTRAIEILETGGVGKLSQFFEELAKHCM